MWGRANTPSLVAGFAGTELCTVRTSDDRRRLLAEWTPLDGTTRPPATAAAAPEATDLGPYTAHVLKARADARRLVYTLADGIYELDHDPASPRGRPATRKRTADEREGEHHYKDARTA